MASERRLEALSRHLASASVHGSPSFDTRKLYLFLERDNVELRAQMLQFMVHAASFRPQYHLSLEDFRALTLQRLKDFVAQGFFKTSDYLNDPLRFWAGLEVLTYCDYSLSIKAGVHFTLCGGTICKLGTQRHHAAYLPGMDTLALKGCFAMTELGHGSNVMGIETQATYDPAAGEFVISTPTNTASKFWIGGAGTDSNLCTVFAQLSVGGKWEGPHVFAVRIRDDAGRVTPGVRIKDNGHKAGLNGVDNGQIWFENVRVPREALLDRYASVAPDGAYSSPIPSIPQRFGTMVGGLTGGRILIAQGAVDATKICVTIALRYACQREQFGNKLIMDYLTHQRRLLPGLACTFALQLAMLRLKALYVRARAEDSKLLHVMSSGLKAGATWSRSQIMQDCRECCGGQGFLSANRIGVYKNDMDVDVTFEGDNTVMMQQVAKALLGKATTDPPRVRRPTFSDSALGDPSQLLQLLQFREECLTAEIAAEMRTAQASASDKRAAAKAAGAAYEDNLDKAVSLGWAYVERLAFQGFVEELEAAPADAAGPLRQLAMLYGLTRLERSAGFHLAHGVLTGEQAATIRTAVNALCGQLAARRGQVAVALCDSFGIPDELLLAPIAFDWRVIGSGDREL